ncbi:hypothetical protein APHAL10511_007573 [Amanita phalloides]|nr:hypothetical protein APHAL10511_007573 [Amanita phalloides]
MRVSHSEHRVPLRASAREIWPRTHADFRPWLHLQNIAVLLDQFAPHGESSISGKGKKRALSSQPSFSRSKRARTDNDSQENTENDHLIKRNWPENRYPLLSPPDCIRIEPHGEFETVPVWHHTFQIQLYKDGGNLVHMALEPAQRHQEELFNQSLKALFGHIEEPVTLDLGAVEFFEFSERLVANVPDERSNSNWLCLLPTLAATWDDDSIAPVSGDLLMACHVMRLMRRVAIQGNLKLVVLPFDWTATTMSEDVPLHLIIELDMSFILPFIFEPCPPRTPKTLATRFEQSTRQLLRHIYNCSFEPRADNIVNIPFFYSNLKPAPFLPSKRAEDAMQPQDLLPQLLPFQRRSVAWLLHREGKSVSAQGKIIPSAGVKEYSFWDKIQEGNHTWFYNRLSGLISQEIAAEPPALGGILAEEPGLGKTLETIALMLLNPAPTERNPTIKRWDPETRLEVSTVKTTLIVTPPSLQSQWVDELKMHAPSLKVLVYEGWSKITPKPKIKKTKKAAKNAKPRAVSRHSKNARDDRSGSDDLLDDNDLGLLQSFDWPSEANQYDVVITTYQVLRSDLDVARAVPIRPRRENAVYVNIERPRSPLVRCEWYRVVMDEVQMVGGGKIEDMVSLIPRYSSLAVSGTPARAQISDLIHVLGFLRVGSVIGSSRMWTRLLTKAYAKEFAQFIQNYAIRTSKASVRHELTIPQQRRFLVPIELGMIERHVYDQAFEAVLLEIGLDARGVAASSGWDVDGNVLRSAIRRLRGICTHPQVGQLQRQNDKLFKPGTVKTMADVLNALRDANWRNVMEDWKSKILLLVRLAQLQQHVADDFNRYHRALGTLQEAEKQVNDLIGEINVAMDEHRAKGELLKKEAAARREYSARQANDASTSAMGKGKGKEREVSLVPSDKEEEDLEDKGLPRNPMGDEHATRRRALQHRLREIKLVLHKVKFLQGDMSHMLGEVYYPAETLAYDAAEAIRRDLLKASEREASRAMVELEQEATEERIPEGSLLIEIPLFEQGGIRTYDLMEEGNDIVEVLNDQSTLLWEWRTHITELLTEPLSNSNSEADGREYQRNLDNQGEAETYLQAYAALLADRREALSSERNLLAAHEGREHKARLTKAARKAQNAAALSQAVDDDMEGLGQLDGDDDDEKRPEHVVLLKELSDRRKALLQMLNGRAVKSIQVDLQAAHGRIKNDKDPEKIIISNAIATIRQFMKEQNALMDKLETDIAAIRKAFNQRVMYFRQLQEISDSVSEVTWNGDIKITVQECIQERAILDAKINTNRARYRYMLHLAKRREQGQVDEDEETCILCRTEFIRGFITQCAHVFCEGCLKAWMLKKEGKTCPVCRVALNPDSLERFAINQEEHPARPLNGEPAPRSRRKIDYNVIYPQLFDEIQAMESFGDFGSKVQTLVRHLLYLQSTDAGAKSIVFSAWSDSLYIVKCALQENGIKCLRIDQRSKGQSAANKFKSDPTISVLLLHGERENAGLNITCASRVFLLESVVHHSFEIQAIARIDRMGQTRSTEVYCYYAEDTVERNILDLAARQGLSLYTQDKSEGTLDLTSFSNITAEKPRMEAPTKKQQKGDFIFRVDDMLAVLFPHMYEEDEYLVGETEGPTASGSGERD